MKGRAIWKECRSFDSAATALNHSSMQESGRAGDPGQLRREERPIAGPLRMTVMRCNRR